MAVGIFSEFQAEYIVAGAALMLFALAALATLRHVRLKRRGGLRPAATAATAAKQTAIVRADKTLAKIGRRGPDVKGVATMNAEQLVFDQVRTFLDAADVRYRTRDEVRVIEAGFKLESGRFPVFIQVQDEPTLVVVITELPLTIPEALRPQAAEVVARANHGLRLGHFDLDMSDGEVTYRATMPAGEDGIERDPFESLMRASLWTVDKYHRAFGRLVFGDDLSPAEVIAEVEMAD